MRRVIARAVVMVLLCVSNLSCGGDAPATSLYPVHGKITYGGQPAEEAIVSLQPDGSAPVTKQGHPIVPMGVAGEDGTFTISCSGLGDGAPAGKYKVMVSWRPSAKVPAAKSLLAKKKKSGDYDASALMPGDILGGRYSNPAKPLLTAEVTAGPNELSFELKD
jgi:hypothetical protein